jgi:DNA-binding Lrp family transcriptional regulator
MKQLGDSDQQLISLLQANARESVSNLARKLGVSRTAIQERMNKLQRNGVIEGYTVKLNPDWMAEQIKAFVSMEVEPKHSAKVIAALQKMTPVQALWSVSGRIDVLILVRASTTAEIDRLLDEIGAIDGITRTESSVVLTSRVSSL